MPAFLKINVHKKNTHAEETMRKPCVNLIYFPGLSFILNLTRPAYLDYGITFRANGNKSCK